MFRTYSVTETDARDTSEFTLKVPVVGRITFAQWELTTVGDSTTMRPTFRGATGAWDGAGAGSIDDINRASAAAAQGQIVEAVPYYCPGGTMYVRSGYDGTAGTSAGKLRVTFTEGH